MMGIHLRLCVQTTEQRWESTPTAPNNSLTAYRIHQHPRRNISPNNLVCRSLLPSATLYDLYDLQIPYEQAWAWQKQLVENICSNNNTEDSSTSISKMDNNAAILLQHQPVYTLGAGATEAHLRFDPEFPPLPLYRIERGGEVTYHGPGQLVLYPILNLKLFNPDLHWYLRSLEEVVIRALEEVSGLQGERVPGLTGVWVNGKKVAAIGVRATKWVSYHGLALNVTPDLAPFQNIVPCGISDKEVASVAGLLLEQAESLKEGSGYAEQSVRNAMSSPAFSSRLLEEYRYGLVAAMEEVFEMEWGRVVQGGAALSELESMVMVGED